MISPRRIAPLALSLSLSLQGTHARAQPIGTPDPTSEARLHFDRGLALFNQQNFTGALAEFRRAYELSSRVSLLFNLGATYQALHRYPEAAAAIEEYLRRAENLPAAQRSQVTEALDQIRGFIGHVRVLVDPPDAAVTIDDEAVSAARLGEPIPVGSGRHIVSATAPGRSPAQATLEVASGDTRTLSLQLDRLPVAQGPSLSAAPTLEFRGVSEGTTVELDGRVISTAVPLSVSPGPHRIAARGAGLDPWSGELRAAEGQHRVITLHLASTRGLRPEIFALASVATGAFAAATLSFGLLTLSERSNFSMFTVLNTESEASADRGVTYRTVTNVMLSAAVVSAITSAIVLSRTRFSRSERSRVEVALSPTLSGLSGSLRWSF